MYATGPNNEQNASGTPDKAISFLIDPASRESALDVLHIMPRWSVLEESTDQGLYLHFTYSKK